MLLLIDIGRVYPEERRTPFVISNPIQHKAPVVSIKLIAICSKELPCVQVSDTTKLNR